MRDKRRVLIIGILALIVIAVGGIAAYYWYENTYYVSTEDAAVSSDLVSVIPKISGQILELNADQGDIIKKNQILARLEMNDLPDTSVEQSLIRSLIDGVVVARQGTLGEMAMTGQTMFTLADPENFYVTANVEETKVGKIKVGQPVDISIDQFGSQKFSGNVKSIGEAANSALSIFSASTSGTFTKVVQRIPVKIQLDKSENKILPGTNAVVKIHVK